MAKPDPALPDPARSPFACEIATRFADLDTNMHLSDVALARCVMVRVKDNRPFPIADAFRASVKPWMLQT